MKQKTKFKQTEIGKIPEDWDVENIGDVAKFQYGLGESAEKQGEFVYIRITDINSDGTLNKNSLSYISKEKVKDNTILKKGDVLVARTGATYGKTCLFKEDFNASYGGFLIKFLFDKNKVNNNFFFQFSRSKIYWYQAENLVSGGAQPQFNANTISDLVIPIPPLPEQKAIAKILSSLDEKIELNNKMNKTLEAIGQAIFKGWFVEGKKGDWGELGEYISFFKGKKPNELFNNKEKNFLPQILINVLDGATPQYVLPEGLVTLNENEPIMVMDGASSGRIEIGFNGIIGSTLSKIICDNNQLSNYYIYYFLKLKQEDINKNTTGTSIPHTDKGKIKNYKIYLPDKNKLELFDKLAMLINQKIINNKKQSQTLSQIGDALLPKLMSGKVRVK